MNYDLIVVGAGMAGLIAAAKAKEQGQKVLVLAQGQGALTLSSGTIDLIGKPNQLQVLLNNQSNHPYAKVGMEDTLEAINFFRSISEKMNNPYLAYSEGLKNNCPYLAHADDTNHGTRSLPKEDCLKNFYLPTAFGTFKPSYLAPLNMVKGDLREKGDTFILGFEELKDFSAALVAANLQHVRQKHGIEGDCKEIKLSLKLSAKGLNAFDLASLIDKRESREQVLAAIKAALKARFGGCTAGKQNKAVKPKARVGIPAILGTSPNLEVFKEFEKELGVDLFEIPTLQPSVAGIRLNAMLVSYLKEKGVRILYASPVMGVENFTKDKAGCAVKKVLVESAGGRSTTFKTKNLILATGGVYGGGIVSNREGFKEKIISPPLQLSSNNKHTSDNEQNPIAFVSKHSPYYAMVGVEVNEHLRPKGEEGNNVANLYVVGRTLAHYDPVIEKSGHGVAIATGYKAALETGLREDNGGE